MNKQPWVIIRDDKGNWQFYWKNCNYLSRIGKE